MRWRWVLLGLVLPFAAGAFGLTTVGLGAALAAIPGAGSGTGPPTGTGPGGPGAGTGTGDGPSLPDLPPAPLLGLYASAAAGTCPGLPWPVLAAVGTAESDNGRSDAPGVASGANWAGAEGPMQFEPATFAEYALPVPPGGARPASPYDAVDAVWAAARLLCANGAARGDLPGAVFAYNHSAAYVAEVLHLAASIDEMTGAGS